MKLQGRNLSIKMKGEDVKLLQSEMHKLGYDNPAPMQTSTVWSTEPYRQVSDFYTGMQGLTVLWLSSPNVSC